jgi:outer membrane protein
VLDQLGNLSELREEQLRLMIGAPGGEKLAVGEDIRADLAAPAAASLDDLVRRAQDRRLDFRVLDKGIAAKDKQSQAERANGYPRLSAFATVEDARPNPRVFPQADKFELTWLAGVQLSWQLGDTLNAETTRKRLIAETDELRADRENLYRGTRLEVLSAMQAVQLAVHSLATSQKGLAAAEEGYRVRKELLAAERATAVELVDAETDLTRARIAALNARVDLRVALAQLGHAIGDDATPGK